MSNPENPEHERAIARCSIVLKLIFGPILFDRKVLEDPNRQKKSGPGRNEGPKARAISNPGWG